MVSFQYVTLPVKEEELTKLRDWYITHLGLKSLWESSGFVMLGGEGGGRIGLHAGEGLSEPGSVQLHFAVADVDETYRKLLEQGLEFTQEPSNTPWGYRVATLPDPAGHTVEIYTEIE